MTSVEFLWLSDERSLKEALQGTFDASGQMLKKHFSSKQLERAIRAREATLLPLDLVNHLKINPVYTGAAAKVLAVTPDYLALHKPPGVHSHPHRYSDTDTLLNYCAATGLWKPLEVNTGNYDRGLLYRLDLETSGLMILACSDQLLKRVRENFALEMKRKFYWAVVKGSFDKEGLWTHWFRAAGPRGSKQTVSTEGAPGFVEGSLAVQKLAEENDLSLVLVNLKTGHRHQIRAQLAALGFPILGDELYGGGEAPRLFLHAFRYEWLDVLEDPEAELFERFFDLHRALQMSHDVLWRF